MMLQESQMWVAIALVVYLLVWWVLVMVLKMFTPKNEEESAEYSEKHGIPYMNIRDMVIGIAALWVLWLVLGILWLCYWLISSIVRGIKSLFA